MTVQRPDAPGVTPVPTGVLRRADISAGARALYAILLSYGYGPPAAGAPTQEKLAADVGCSVRTVQRRLRELQAVGLLRVRQLGINRPNAYEILGAAPEASA